MEEDRIEKLEEEFEENGEISKHSRSMRMIFIGIAAGLLACIIGAATRTPEAMYAGVFITPISLFSGGLLLNRLDTTVRLGMLIAGGLTMIFIVAYAFQWAISTIMTR